MLRNQNCVQQDRLSFAFRAKKAGAKWVRTVYLRCSPLRRFCGFSPFCFFVESVSYVVSIPPRGSTPILCRYFLSALDGPTRTRGFASWFSSCDSHSRGIDHPTISQNF